MMLISEARQQIVDYACRMSRERLVVGTSGNISLRHNDLIAITPAGLDYEAMRMEDVAVVDLDGQLIDGRFPSSELPLHLALHRALDVAGSAVTHTHSDYATVLSTIVDVLPAIHYQIVSLGGPVPVVAYETFGSPELASRVAAGISGRSAILMRNHGAVAVGSSLSSSYKNAVTLEWLAKTYYLARTLGDPTLLDTEELCRVREQQARMSARITQRSGEGPSTSS